MTDDAPRLRLRILAVVALSLFAALFSRLWFLQVVDAESHEQRVEANTHRQVPIAAPRGRIFDASGRTLVDNKVITVVSIDKAVLERELPAGRRGAERREMLTELAAVINRSGHLLKVDDIESMLRNSLHPRLGDVPIALDVDDEVMLYVGERPETFPGVTINRATVRYYPYGELAAHVLGHVGRINEQELADRRDSPLGYDRNDEIGKGGVERMFEEELRGTPGVKVYEVDSRDRIVREVTELGRDPVPGHDLHLTIDVDLQKLAEDQLRAGLETAGAYGRRVSARPPLDAPAGAVVVLDPSDGSVRAMASFPTYEPAEFVMGISQTRFQALQDPANHSPILNRAIQGEYAPASTFKLFTAYAAIDDGFLGAGALPGIEQRVDDPGTFQLRPCDGDKCSWTNARGADGIPARYTGPDAVDLRRSLTVSSDVYYYRIAAEIARSGDRREAIQAAAKLFGLGEATGVALPGERSGRVPTAELRRELHEAGVFPEGRWFVGDTINLSIGQGEVVATPIQLANAYGTFVNGGVRYAPNVVAEVRDHEGNLVRSFAPREVDRIAVPERVRIPILDGLLGVTADPSGTAYRAFNDPAVGAAVDLARFPVAGKTGTAEVHRRADTAMFVGVGPAPVPGDPVHAANVPRWSIAVVLEEAGFGGMHAAPVAARLFEALSQGQVPRALSTYDLRDCLRRLAAEGAEGVVAANGESVEERCR